MTWKIDVAKYVSETTTLNFMMKKIDENGKLWKYSTFSGISWLQVTNDLAEINIFLLDGALIDEDYFHTLEPQTTLVLQRPGEQMLSGKYESSECDVTSCYIDYMKKKCRRP